ncbi:hypothetical protein H8356DRAFT_1635888 [Neocallimastix lanati (nom. inval.)]|nr:hypothetical protein H8356DRAFT_1635888 [Neocallimastix sp. JGI-2020a]
MVIQDILNIPTFNNKKIEEERTEVEEEEEDDDQENENMNDNEEEEDDDDTNDSDDSDDIDENNEEFNKNNTRKKSIESSKDRKSCKNKLKKKKKKIKMNASTTTTTTTFPQYKELMNEGMTDSDPLPREISWMKNVPFLPVSSNSTSKSHSVIANVQQVLSMMKQHNVRKCGACREKNMEIRRILYPSEDRSRGTNNSSGQQEPFNNLCNCSEALINLLQFYNKEYENNLIIYKDLLCEANQCQKKKETEKLAETEDKIYNLYLYLKKKSDEMLMIKYLIESLPKKKTKKRTGSTKVSEISKLKQKEFQFQFQSVNPSSTLSSSSSNKKKKSRIAMNSHPHWKKMNSLPYYRKEGEKEEEEEEKEGIGRENGEEERGEEGKSTLDLLRFSQRIQEFLSKEHELRCT